MLIVCDKDYKVSGKLKIREEQEPYPNDEEVLIRVKSFGINRPDLLQKKGLYPPPVSASKILGLECSCLLYTSPSPRDYAASRMPSSA